MSLLRTPTKSSQFPEVCSSDKSTTYAYFESQYWKVIYVDVKKRGAETNSWGKAFLRHRNLLCLHSPVMRVKYLLQTSSMIMQTMFLSGRSHKSLQVKPRRQVVSYAPVWLNNTAPAFCFVFPLLNLRLLVFRML